MWLSLALLSAMLLGLYDVSKKHSLKDNAVIPILWCNTVICSLLLIPLMLLSEAGKLSPGSLLFVPHGTLEMHLKVMLKALIVLSSWICGYAGIKHLPITLVGPINATRPVMVLLGGTMIMGERLNLYQWIGVSLAVISFFMLSRSGRREGIDFRHDKWLYLTILSNVLGAISGLYDKFLMGQMSNMFVQPWCNIYQSVLMGLVLLVWLRGEGAGNSIRWKWSIPLISVFLTMADFAYFYALTDPDSMISVVSMIRRSSVLVSFACGALLFHEKNLKSKALDLILVLIGLIFLIIGSQG